jgi:hypothetical protein
VSLEVDGLNSLQGNVKTREGRQHPDRDAQFRYIAETVTRAQRRGQPAISVDTRRRSWWATSRMGAARGGPRGSPTVFACTTSSFASLDTARRFPMVSTISAPDEGWVSIGIDHDTASCAVNAIRRWWRQMWRAACSRARSLVITADAGGRNDPRVRLWKCEGTRSDAETIEPVNCSITCSPRSALFQAAHKRARRMEQEQAARHQRKSAPSYYSCSARRSQCGAAETSPHDERAQLAQQDARP